MPRLQAKEGTLWVKASTESMDHIASILGYGDLKWGNITITRVYFIEGLGHNLFSVGQFCDADLEVAFRRNTCFIRDLDGVDLLKGNRSTNLYTINLYDMASASPICLMARATPTKLWLWHQRLCHLNFNTINDLAKNDLVSGLPNNFVPLVSKKKQKSLTPTQTGSEFKAAASSASYGFVIKDEMPEVIKNFLKKIYVRLQAPVIIVRTDNKTKFKNHVLKEYFDSVGITHETSTAKTHQQNGVVERRNRTLVEAARIMLIFSHAPLFLSAEAIATACILKTIPLFTDISTRYHTSLFKAENQTFLAFMFLGLFVIRRMIMGISANLVQKVYVDDIIFGSTDPRYATLFSNLMKSRFKMSMIEEMTFFLSLQVNQSPSGIFINQYKYVHEILKKYGLNTSDIVGTPMDINDKLDLDQIGTSVDATKYRSMIGALIYLTLSRPDIVHATCVCARYQAHPTEKHLKEVLCARS
nr:integrase, catalytic region, zinc finger, CCHC-type, peptidase aspartic, catalytic [Tanacetum cinerariifolium]